MSDAALSAKELQRRFRYHPSGYLVRKVKTAPNTWVGQVVQGYRRYGYRYIFTKGKDRKQKRIALHRAIFAVVHGRFPKGILDHRDRDPSNNRIENLREVDLYQNAFNRKLDTRNKSGYRGLRWDSCRCRWRVVIGHRGRYQYFGESVSKRKAVTIWKRAMASLGGTALTSSSSTHYYASVKL